jgi:hypothetical protein
MNTIALVDTRLEIPGESIGTVVSTHGTMAAAFKANEAFQSRMRASGLKTHIRIKIVTLKVRLSDGEHVRPSRTCFWRGKSRGNSSRVFYSTSALVAHFKARITN